MYEIDTLVLQQREKPDVQIITFGDTVVEAVEAGELMEFCMGSVGVRAKGCILRLDRRPAARVLAPAHQSVAGTDTR